MARKRFCIVNNWNLNHWFRSGRYRHEEYVKDGQQEKIRAILSNRFDHNSTLYMNK
ncbi:hypothetical protein VCR4J5_1260096 [Vibrio crassostreae]|uniref:Uncharacterized protein n=1 Tax=Vibrio crassostreae TaxID=246167 RepID=A0ABP1WQS7_9VIBR|nr:hypothetical protein VCR4J5_1260096 [Vibrio crassostreae]CDT11149.1 hypothetical protein VCR19J5_1250096 [Vibrio crassostreae]CDT39925.1 hypothetical protein VCR20J5_280082 [Vibrio crassostreae]CDT53528.1 hypothetical protein VCR15J5_670085 [Vibrio crassostreae]